MTQKHKAIWGSIFVIFYGGWLCLCLYVMVVVKFYMGSCHFNYYFTQQCNSIQEAFVEDQTAFHAFAAQDMNYLLFAQTTGIYQCYC